MDDNDITTTQISSYTRQISEQTEQTKQTKQTDDGEKTFQLSSKQKYDIINHLKSIITSLKKLKTIDIKMIVVKGSAKNLFSNEVKFNFNIYHHILCDILNKIDAIFNKLFGDLSKEDKPLISQYLTNVIRHNECNQNRNILIIAEDILKKLYMYFYKNGLEPYIINFLDHTINCINEIINIINKSSELKETIFNEVILNVLILNANITLYSIILKQFTLKTDDYEHMNNKLNDDLNKNNYLKLGLIHKYYLHKTFYAIPDSDKNIQVYYNKDKDKDKNNIIIRIIQLFKNNENRSDENLLTMLNDIAKQITMLLDILRLERVRETYNEQKAGNVQSIFNVKNTFLLKHNGIQNHQFQNYFEPFKNIIGVNLTNDPNFEFNFFIYIYTTCIMLLAIDKKFKYNGSHLILLFELLIYNPKHMRSSLIIDIDTKALYAFFSRFKFSASQEGKGLSQLAKDIYNVLKFVVFEKEFKNLDEYLLEHDYADTPYKWRSS